MTMTMTSDEPLLTVEEVAKILRVRPRWVYEAVGRGDLPFVRVGRYVRFSRADVEEWIRAGGKAS